MRILGDLGQSISSAESSVSISRLSLPYKPEEIKKQKEEHEQFQSNQSKIRKDFSVNVDLNKGDGSYYYHGDPFIINVELEKKSYLKVLYRQVNGETVLIYESDLRLEPGNHRIPPENHSSGKSIVTRQVVEQKKLLSSHQPTVSDKVERILGAGGLFLI